MKILVTGGAGFIGSAFVRHILETYPEYQVIVLDALTYAGNLDNFPEAVWTNPRFFFWHGAVQDRQAVERLVSQVDTVVHFAAETHVDNSIYQYNTDDFIDTDVKGTQVLLDAVRHSSVERFIQISTSEVYGTALSPLMTEEHPLNPRSPYAAAKCGADRLVYAYVCTFDIPAVIIRPFNNYGPYQHIEKFIPRVITSALQDKPFPLHGNGTSSRDWVYVEDTARGVAAALHADIEAIKGQVINIATARSVDIGTIARMVLEKMGKPASLIEVVEDRPGQVERHTGANERARHLLGWTPAVPFEEGLEMTIAWYRENPQWWRKLRMKELSSAATLLTGDREAAGRMPRS
ncbi:MAG: dTDP-glucose 4,6-dehydratase [Armatimonadota bacterium]